MFRSPSEYRAPKDDSRDPGPAWPLLSSAIFNVPLLLICNMKPSDKNLCEVLNF